jgi:MG2 domain.
MRKTLLTLALLAFAGTVAAQTPVERLYVSTDRNVYLAGDAIWCSLTDLDENGRFSNASAVSYMELLSEDGTVCTAKIGLLEGRGAGSFRIPVTTPTGTYRLVAYTAVNAAEQGKPWMAGSRVLTIFNSTSGARVTDGVEILDEQTYEALAPEAFIPEGSLELSTRIRVPKGAPTVLMLHNAGPAASLSLSVFHEDGLLPAARETHREVSSGRFPKPPP